MKILKLVLENFEAIQYCMNSPYMEIDFSKSENRICLFIGPNGSGKTTVLSLLNPFSSLGNLDVRDSYHLITPGKNGRKEIWIQDDCDVYKIQHNYTATKDTHTTKSFIQKNDAELNPNGNVSSFKEIVKEELGLELEYMKLVRLGPNVKSLIDLSSTERKAFMGKLLDSIGVYMEYYKKVNDNMRALKEMISHTVDKLNKSKYQSKKEYQDEIDHLQSELDDLENELRDYQDKYAIYHNEIEELGPISVIRDVLSKDQKALSKMNKTKDRLGEVPSNIDNPSEYYKKKLDNTKNEIFVKTNIKTSLESILAKDISDRNNIEEKLHRLEVAKEKSLNVERHLDELKQTLSDVEKRLSERNKNLATAEVKVGVSEFEDFMVFLKTSDASVRKVLEFGKEPVKAVLDLMRKNKNVMSVINSGVLDSSSSDETEIFVNKLMQMGNFDTEINCENTSCTAYIMWSFVKGSLANRDTTKYTPQFYQYMELAYRGLKPVIDGFRPFSRTIDALPEDIRNTFTTDHIFDRISDGKPLYHVKTIEKYYSLVKEKDDRDKAEELKKSIEDEIARYTEIQNADYLSAEYDDRLLDLEAAKDVAREHREEIDDLTEELRELQYDAETYEDAYSFYTSYTTIQDEYNEYTDKYNRSVFLSTTVSQLNDTISRTSMRASSIRESLEKLKADYSIFKDTKKNLNTYQKHYDTMEYVKRSLATKEGIPTIITKHYLKDVEVVTNELLDIVYDGKITIDKFNISASEFTIPVYSRGKLLPDVKLVSQGESAFLSVALSFALVAQSLGKYNIMALDEVDAALDSTNRGKFIEILENQIERVGSEQNFLITHNDMFSYYPVDIVDFGFENNRKVYQLANFIDIKLEKGGE